MNKLILLIALLLIGLASSKKCGGEHGKCPEGFCCSRFGFCGKLDSYCGNGCQPDYGICSEKKKMVVADTETTSTKAKDDSKKKKKKDKKTKDKNETKEDKLADTIINVVGDLIDDVDDKDDKEEVVEEVINALESELSSSDSDLENTTDDGSGVVEDKTDDDVEEVIKPDDEEEGEGGDEPVNEKDNEEEEKGEEKKPTKSNNNDDDKCSKEVFGVAKSFNGFFFGDFKGYSSDVQGRLAAKGTVNISGGYQNGAFIYDPVKHNQQTNLDCTDSKMNGDIKYSIVAGTLNFRDGGEIINGGIAYQNSFDIPGYIKEAIERHKCPIEKKSVIDFDKEKQNLVALSNKLGNASENAKTKNEWGKLSIDLTQGQKNYIVKIDNINQYWDIAINENGVNTDDIVIIFNLPGTEITFTNFDISGLNKYATRIIWNAPNAKKILIQNFRIQGSLLAPNADIEGYNGNIQGQMIANSFNGNLQIDWVPLYGCI